jgi:hypothetical protein
MLHTRLFPGSAACRPRLFRPFLLAGLLAIVALGQRAPAADPPADAVDDFRAAFRKNLDTITLRSVDLPSLRDKLRQLKVDDPDEKKEDTKNAAEKVKQAEAELQTALKERNEAGAKELKPRS